MIVVEDEIILGLVTVTPSDTMLMETKVMLESHTSYAFVTPVSNHVGFNFQQSYFRWQLKWGQLELDQVMEEKSSDGYEHVQLKGDQLALDQLVQATCDLCTAWVQGCANENK
ncbi:hypothetical protein R6Q59_018918 [Mikania micrantha]